MRVATTDPATRTIRISNEVMPPLFDKVYLHEAAHAAMVEAGMGGLLPVVTDELLAWFLESHAVEVIASASKALGRSVCVDGLCAIGADDEDSRDKADG